MKLTERQRRFVEAYVETGNATEAARRAGYSKKTANIIGPENLSKLSIKKAIEERMAEIEKSKTATAEEIIQLLSSMIRGEIEEEVVTTEGTGMGCSESKIVKKQIGTKERLKAAELILRRYPLQAEIKEQELRIEKLQAELNERKQGQQEEQVTFVFERGATHES